MRVQEMIMYVDNYLDSRGLANPSIRKNAIRKVAAFIKSTDIYLKNGHLNLPVDKDSFKDAYCRYKQNVLSGAEKSAINHMYDIINGKISNNTANNAIQSSDIDSPRYDFNTKPKELVKANKNHNTDFKSGLEPWVGGEPKVLILGSLPGDESIKQQAYYANKRNAFWKIMRALYNNNTETDNKKFIISCGIALWDCVHSAIRKGSLDSAIKDDSVVANDIRGLIAKYPTINTIILNGGKAEEYYNKYCKGIDCTPIRLISTSPAATRVFEEKLKEWSIVKDLTK